LTQTKTVIAGCLLAGLVAFSGCTEKNGKPGSRQSADNIPSDLRALQGEWVSVSTNGGRFCDVIFHGYYMRLKYRESVDDNLFRKNSSFESIDSQRGILVEHGKTSGVKYSLLNRNEVILLELEFYNNIAHEWIKVCLKKK